MDISPNSDTISKKSPGDSFLILFIYKLVHVYDGHVW